MRDIWFIAREGRRSGPYSDVEVLDLVAGGAVQHGVLAWKPGMADWVPLSVCLPLARQEAPQPEAASGTAAGAAPGGAFGADPLETRAPRVSDALPLAEKVAEPVPRSRRRALVSGALVAIAVIAYGVIFTFNEYQSFGRFAGLAHAALWGVALLSLLGAATVIWTVGRNRWTAAKAVSLIGCLSAIAFAVPMYRMSLAVGRIAEARGSFSNYQLTYDAVTGRARFDGVIGPGIADALDRLVTVNADVNSLQISSPGGLIDEAMDATRVLERHPNLIVEVTGECNSACIALFMAAQVRSADVAATFGFHRPSSVTGLPSFASDAVDAEARTLRDYVVRRGFPAARFDALSRDEALQSLTSIEMQELGGVHRLTREGAEVSVQSAKWHWIADIMPDNGLRSLARSIAQSNEPTLLSAGVPIFAAARAQDNARTRTAILALMPQLIPRVIESADPELALNYLKASSATIDYLGSIEAWEECANAVGGRGLSDPQAIPPNIARAEFESLAEAIRSASAAQWVRRPIPHVAAADAEVALDAAIRAANSQGLDNTLFESDARTRCLMTYLLMAEVNRRDPLQAVAIHRTYWTQ